MCGAVTLMLTRIGENTTPYEERRAPRTKREKARMEERQKKKNWSGVEFDAAEYRESHSALDLTATNSLACPHHPTTQKLCLNHRMSPTCAVKQLAPEVADQLNGVAQKTKTK